MLELHYPMIQFLIILIRIKGFLVRTCFTFLNYVIINIAGWGSTAFTKNDKQKEVVLSLLGL